MTLPPGVALPASGAASAMTAEVGNGEANTGCVVSLGYVFGAYGAPLNTVRVFLTGAGAAGLVPIIDITFAATIL